jgi:hypothetical protein
MQRSTYCVQSATLHHTTRLGASQKYLPVPAEEKFAGDVRTALAVLFIRACLAERKYLSSTASRSH